MRISILRTYLLNIFHLNSETPEASFTVRAGENVFSIGYATNLTPDVIAQAARKKVDLIITHHDAWDFLYGMKNYCLDQLKRNGISHFYVHMPLDAADFGISEIVMHKLNARTIAKTTLIEGYHCGRIGELQKPVRFGQIVKRVEKICLEKVMRWQNNSRLIKRIGFVPGAGMNSKDMKEHIEKKCDVYITGEKNLYTLEYAQFAGINLIVGSHTFTELPGVENLAKLLVAKFKELKAVQLQEPHFEIPPPA